MGCGASKGEVTQAAGEKPPAAKPAEAAETKEVVPIAAEAPDRKTMLEDLFDECDDDGPNTSDRGQSWCYGKETRG